MYNHIMAGKDSFTMPEALMKMYDESDLDYNLALRSGKQIIDKSPKETMDASCSEMTQLARSILEYGRMKAQDTAMVLGAAGTLLDAIENCYCCHICGSGKYIEKMDCPVNRLIDYIQWLEEEMMDNQLSETLT